VGMSRLRSKIPGRSVRRIIIGSEESALREENLRGNKKLGGSMFHNPDLFL